MRKILHFLLSFLLLQQAIGQTTPQKVPSKRVIDAQIQELRNEGTKQIIEMERQIAEAKKNNAPLEEIKDLENQLTTMRKMLGMAEKASNMNSAKPRTIHTSTAVIPGYKSPFIRLMKQPVAAPTEAQAKDRLLWYKGRKINDSMLVTTQARVVLYSRRRNVVIVQPDERRDSAFYRLAKNLPRSRQWTNTYVNNISAVKNSFFDYPLVMMAMKEYDLIEKQYNKIVNNTIQLPGTGSIPISQNFRQTKYNKGGPSTNSHRDDLVNAEPHVEQMYAELQSLLNNPPPLDFPPPPEHKLDLCFYCDTSIQTRYHKELETWSDKFNEYEAKVVRTALTIYRYCALLGLDIDGVGIPSLDMELMGAQFFALNRLSQKVEILKQQYGNDIYRYEAVISTVLGVERQKALLGMAGDTFSYDFAIFESRIFENFIFQRIAARDYNVIFNYSLILGFARQRALLGGGADDNYLQDVIDAVVKLNRFSLTLNIEFEFQIEADGKPLLIANGNLSTANKIYVKLGQNQNCKWQFYLYDPDYVMGLSGQGEEDFKIPLTVSDGIKKVKRKDDVWDTYPYAGPTDMLMVFPSFRISFCQGGGSDSAMMDILRYKTEDLSGYDMSTNYTVDLLEYVNKMLVSISKTKSNQNEFTNIASEMMNVSSQATVDNPTGYAKLDKMQVDFKMNGIQHEFQKRVTETTKGDNTVILFDAQNGTDYLINSTTNTPNSEFHMDIKKGVIKLKVVLDPL